MGAHLENLIKKNVALLKIKLVMEIFSSKNETEDDREIIDTSLKILKNSQNKKFKKDWQC